LNATPIVIDIITASSGGNIIVVTVTIIVAVTIAVAVSTIAVVAVIVDVASSRCFIIVIVVVLLCGQSEELDQTTPQRHCPWHVDGIPTLGSAAHGLAALTQGHYVPDVVLSEISWSLSNGSWS
jgi:hypothetical protein